MKKEALLLALIISIFLLVSAGFTFQNEPDGFRELKWGDLPTEDMIYFTTLEGARVYNRLNEEMHIGSAQFYLIAYLFYGQPEKFMSIILYFRGEKNYDLLKTICRGRFGEETDQGFYLLGWLGQKVIITLRYNTIEEEGSLSLTNMPILMEKKRIEGQKEIEKSKKDW